MKKILLIPTLLLPFIGACKKDKEVENSLKKQIVGQWTLHTHQPGDQWTAQPSNTILLITKAIFSITGLRLRQQPIICWAINSKDQENIELRVMRSFCTTLQLTAMIFRKPSTVQKAN